MPLTFPQRGQNGPRHTENWWLYDTLGGTPPGTGAWASGKYKTRPTDWDYVLHRLYPSGTKGYPLTALITKMRKKVVMDPEFHWLSKTLPSQYTPTTNVFRDPGLTVPYVGGGVIDDVLYAQVPLIGATHFRDGHEVAFINDDVSAFLLRGKAVAVSQAGANSFISVKLLENDTVAPPTHAGTPNGGIVVIGDVNPEFGAVPNNIAYDPVKYTNFTQIFRSPLRISNTARATTYKPGSPGDYAELLREALELHGIQKEKAFLFSLPTEKIGTNNMPERTTGGLLWFVQNHGGFVGDFRTINTPDFTLPAAAQWTTYGSRFLDYVMAMVTRYGGYGNRICFCGWGAVAGVQNAILYGPKTQYNIVYKDSIFGMRITTLVSPFGEFELVVHPLFTYFPNFRNSMFIISFEDLEYRPLNGRETIFHAEAANSSSPPGHLDGVTEEYLTEAGLAVHFPCKFGCVHGIGLDRP